jgi:hypothetical protein
VIAHQRCPSPTTRQKTWISIETTHTGIRLAKPSPQPHGPKYRHQPDLFKAVLLLLCPIPEVTRLRPRQDRDVRSHELNNTTSESTSGLPWTQARIPPSRQWHIRNKGDSRLACCRTRGAAPMFPENDIDPRGKEHRAIQRTIVLLGLDRELGDR